jgi:enediyne biosynthesis protein E4
MRASKFLTLVVHFYAYKFFTHQQFGTNLHTTIMARMIQLQFCLAFFANTLHAQPLFTKVVDATNPVTTFTNTPAAYKGANWVDMNGDNLPDLFTGQMFVFKNLGNGSFQQMPNLNGGVTGQGASGSSWGDMDNDGDLDCITASIASGLHINNGDFTFNLLTTTLPNMTNYSAWDCTLADADNNGLLDLVFVHACCSFHPSGPFSCRFFLQTSPGAFTQVTGLEFTDQNKPYTIPVWSDYDLDGDVDLFIGSGPAGSLGPDFCYKNLLRETGSFSLQRLTTAPFDAQQDGQTYNFVDYDNDGDLDMALTNYGGAACRFWKNNQGSYVAQNNTFTQQNAYLTNTWGDMDNDGDLDILVSLDGSPNVIFYRNNNGTFASAQVLGIAAAQIAGIAIADYDNDGDLDVYTNGPSTARTLFRNDTFAQGRSYAVFNLEGTPSNRSAIGAIVRVKANIDGTDKWLIREVSAHNSFQSQNDLRQHFGLLDATVMDSIEVRWPSGTVQRFSNLAVNAFYKIKEGEAPALLVGTITPQPPAPTITVSPNPNNGQFWVKTDANTPIRKIEVLDNTGRLLMSQTLGNAIQATVNLTHTAAQTVLLRVLFDNGQVGLEWVVLR